MLRNEVVDETYLFIQTKGNNFLIYNATSNTTTGSTTANIDNTGFNCYSDSASNMNIEMAAPCDRNISSVQDIIIASTFDFDLKMIIMKYRKNLKLDGSERTLFCKCLIKFSLYDDYNKRFKRADFERISQLIVDLFPTEAVETYYIPAQHGKRARGKLWDQYTHFKSILTNVGLLDRRARNPASTKDDHMEIEESKECEPEVEVLNDEEVCSDLVYLESNAVPWDEVQVRWKRTAAKRASIVRAITTNEYIQRFCCLKTNRGCELYSIDAKLLHPHMLSIETLNELTHKICALLQKRQSFPLSHLLQHTSEDSRRILALISLPYLFPTIYSRINNKAVRLSKAEVVANFFPYFETKDQRDNFQKQLEKQSNDNQIPLSPTIHLFGEFQRPVCVITVHNQSYFIDNPVAAFELYFHMFLALNLRYPKQSQHVWLFAQRKFFGISTATDSKYPAVETLIKSF